MKLTNLSLIATLFFALSGSFAIAGPAQATDSNIPAPVTQLTERISGCMHWGGEEAYDKEREQQITKMMKNFRCSTLEKDEKNILKTYGKDRKIIDTIAKAKQGQ